MIKTELPLKIIDMKESSSADNPSKDFIMNKFVGKKKFALELEVENKNEDKDNELLQVSLAD